MPGENTPREPELGETDDPRALVQGDPAVLAATAQRLARFGDAFARTAHGLQGIDVGAWTGSAADAFHATFHAAPQSWLDAAAAFGRAAQALDHCQDVLGWAQHRAADAVSMYEGAQRARVQALTEYNRQVDVYNAAIEAPHTTPPAMPAPFVDPGADAVEKARAHLDTARAIRTRTATDTARAITAATALAPPLPSTWDAFAAQFSDEFDRDVTTVGQILNGAAEGTEELLRFARTLNPADPYNVTHPAAFLSNISDTAAGLVHAAVHPVELVKDVVGTRWGSDPAGALGRLIPGIVLAATTGGGGAAAGAARRGAMTAAEREAAAAAEGGAARVIEPPSNPTSTPARVTPPTSPLGGGMWNPFPTHAPPEPRFARRPEPAPPAPSSSAPPASLHDVPESPPIADDTGLTAADSRAAAAFEQPEFEPGSISRVLDGLDVHDPGLPPSTPPAPDATPARTPLVQPAAADGSALVQADPMPGAASQGLDAVEERLGGLTTHDPGLTSPVTSTHPPTMSQRKLGGDAVDFADDAAAARYGAEHWNAQAGSLPTSEKEALRGYSLDPPHPTSFEAVNGAARGNYTADRAVESAMADIDKALARQPVHEDVIVARGTGIEHFPEDMADLIGETIHEKAYISTSLGSAAFEHEPAILHLRVPAGTPAIYMEKLSAHNSERELLLGRGLDWTADEVLRVDGTWHVYGRIHRR